MQFKNLVIGKYLVIAIKEALHDAIINQIEKNKFVNDWIRVSREQSEEMFFQSLNLNEEDNPSRAEIKKGAEEWLEAESMEFSAKFLKNAKTEGDKIYLWRCIGTDNTEEFVSLLREGKYQNNFNGVGIYWSWNRDDADCHWGKGAQHLMLECKAPRSAIDLKLTAWLNMSMSTGRDEAEMRLIESKRIEITQIYDKNDKGLLENGEILKVKA